MVWPTEEGCGCRAGLRKGQRQRERISAVVEEVQLRRRVGKARVYQREGGLPSGARRQGGAQAACAGFASAGMVVSVPGGV